MVRNHRPYTLFFILFATAIFIYILIRASQFSFSEDEAFSVLDVLYMRPGYFLGNIANTHLFNTFFLWLELKFLGFEEVFLRIHSVLSFVMFAWVVYKFSIYIDSMIIRILLIGLIVLHPFMLDYFSMARGYALSIAAMMMSLYFIHESVLDNNSKKKFQIYYATFWAGISVIACYVMFTYYIAVLIFYFFFENIGKKTSFTVKQLIQNVWKYKIFWLIHSFFSLGILSLILKLKPSSLHAFWPYNSFWADTIYSLVASTFKSPPSYVGVIFLVFVCLIVFSWIVLVVNIFRNNFFSPSSVFTILFTIVTFLLVLQYYCLNITYLSYRGAIFLYPLIVIMIFWSLREIEKFPLVRLVAQVVLFSLFCGVLLNFYVSFSLSSGIGIVSEAGFEKALKDLEILRSKENKNTISLGVSRAFPATVYYYQWKHHLNGFRNIGFGYELGYAVYFFYGNERIVTGRYDYFLLEKPDIPIVSSQQKIRILYEYPESGIVLAKPL